MNASRRLHVRRAFCIVISCAISHAVVHGAVASDGPIVNGELGECLDDWLVRMEAFGMHGAILVESQGTVVLAKGYGLAHRPSGRPITRNTSFHLGSLGKQFTAACILKLEMMGLVSVDDPISDHLSDVPADKTSITIHHLLTHTAGLPYMPTAALPLALPLEAEPGERWAYSNPGYSLLAEIVANVSGMPFTDFAATHLFGPAGMTNTTSIGDPHWPTDDVAYSYQDGNDLGPVSEDQPDPRFYGAGDFASTVGDLLKWERALRGDSILNDVAKAKFFTEHVRNPTATIGYAYGWRTTTIPGRDTRLVFHQGNYGGFNSDYRRYIDERVTIVFLSNHYLGGRSMRDAVVSNVSRIIHGDTSAVAMPPRVLPIAATPADVPAAAVFPVGDGDHVHAERDDNAIILRGWGQRATHLVFAPDADENTRAFADRAGRVSADAILALANGDETPLLGILSPSIMPDQLVDAARRRLTDWSESLGPLSGVKSLGTAVSGRGESGRITLRLSFARGERLVDIAWGAGGGIYQIMETEAPPARQFRPTTAGFTAFDIFTGDRSDITIEPTPDGWQLAIGGERFLSTQER